MQVVIDISSYDKEWITNGYYIPEEINMRISEAIANGMPIPKGHGKLIDVNDLLDRVELEDNDSNREYNAGSIITLEDVDFIPTIIPADKEDEDAKL